MLPIYRKVIPYVIAVLLITWLFEGDFAGKARRIVNDRQRLNTLLFAGLYIFYGIGLLYSENFDYGLFDLEVKMSIFIFPVLMATVRDEVLSASMARKILWAFVFGVLANPAKFETAFPQDGKLEGLSFLFAFQVLPTIVFFAAPLFLNCPIKRPTCASA